MRFSLPMAHPDPQDHKGQQAQRAPPARKVLRDRLVQPDLQE